MSELLWTAAELTGIVMLFWVAACAVALTILVGLSADSLDVECVPPPSGTQFLFHLEAPLHSTIVGRPIRRDLDPVGMMLTEYRASLTTRIHC